MESRVKLAGHPIHPMLIVLPLGLLSIGVVFDIVYLATNDPTFADVAFWDIGAGIIGGLLAAIFGLTDWLGIPRGHAGEAARPVARRRQRGGRLALHRDASNSLNVEGVVSAKPPGGTAGAAG